MNIDDFILWLNEEIHKAHLRNSNTVFYYGLNIEGGNVKEKLTKYYNDLQFGIDVYRCTRGTFDVSVWWNKEE